MNGWEELERTNAYRKKFEWIHQQIQFFVKEWEKRVGTKIDFSGMSI